MSNSEKEEQARIAREQEEQQKRDMEVLRVLDEKNKEQEREWKRNTQGNSNNN